jgi:biopolymer transport protein ExbD
MAAGGADDDDGVISGINVTPLVDITLVLLIIMMVTARIIVSQSVPMDLPKAAVGKQVQLQFRVDIAKSGDVYVDGKRIEKVEALLPLAREALQKNPDLRAVISADTTVQHGIVMRVMDLLKQAAVNKIAFGVAPIPPEPGAAPKGGEPIKVQP